LKEYKKTKADSKEVKVV